MGTRTADLYSHPVVARRDLMTYVLLVVGVPLLSACGEAAQAGDTFTYYAARHSGSGRWSCEVAALAPADPGAAAGIMIRQTLDAASQDLYFVTTGGGGASLQYRPRAKTTAQSGPTIDPLAATPLYLQMEYSPGQQVILADSRDGATWTNRTVVPFIGVDPETDRLPGNAIPALPITDPYYVGLCVTSRTPNPGRLPGFRHLTGFPEGMAYHAVHNVGGRLDWWGVLASGCRPGGSE